MSETQEFVDAFYAKNGKCCAGCDHWRHINSLAGECLQSKILPGKERADMLGYTSHSMNFPSGHAITLHGHCCALFADTFDWATLPPWYLRKIGKATP